MPPPAAGCCGAVCPTWPARSAWRAAARDTCGSHSAHVRGAAHAPIPPWRDTHPTWQTCRDSGRKPCRLDAVLSEHRAGSCRQLLAWLQLHGACAQRLVHQVSALFIRAFVPLIFAFMRDLVPILTSLIILPVIFGSANLPTTADAERCSWRAAEELALRAAGIALLQTVSFRSITRFSLQLSSISQSQSLRSRTSRNLGAASPAPLRKQEHPHGCFTQPSAGSGAAAHVG